jgi:hypothetical protein
MMYVISPAGSKIIRYLISLQQQIACPAEGLLEIILKGFCADRFTFTGCFKQRP